MYHFVEKDKVSSSSDSSSILSRDNVNTASPEIKKRIIYGYKHKITGKIYHHAVAQTLPPPWKYDVVIKFHRNSQTVDKKDKTQQTSKNISTQVEARNIYINTSGDKCLTYSGSFVHADDVKEDYLSKVVVVQKYIRRWLACQEVLRRKKKILLQHIWDKERFNSRMQLDVDWDKSLRERRVNPRTDEDFLLLFSDLQRWWERKSKCINSHLTESDMKAAFWSLVNEEVKKILQINQKKYICHQKQDTEFKENSLKMAAQPKLWMGYDRKISVETSSTLRGKYFQDLYQTLGMKYISSQDRISALTTLKEMVQHYDGKLSENLIQLANREIDLLLRNTKADRLEGLRSRIQNLFWQLARQPVYNPQMKTVEKDVPKHVLCCASCKRFYTLTSDSTDETLGKSVEANYFTKCAKCSYIENEAWIRKDLEIYNKLLKVLIKDEENRSSISGLIYILQPRDMKHLMEKVWKGESCISGLTNKDDLEFTRYDFEKSWTPWNCLLVTRQEAQILQRTPYPETIYDEKFKECVLQRHAEAKVYFSTIPRFFPYIFEQN
ncbi:IQ motif and ubiquitin-like domain-containing protein isoform X2 [Parasteatoda tepidariorum]|nr:IQ and ubiquitin-like domain-containing protein isoform X2 [Parasteatoda tepidariorum]